MSRATVRSSQACNVPTDRMDTSLGGEVARAATYEAKQHDHNLEPQTGEGAGRGARSTREQAGLGGGGESRAGRQANAMALGVGVVAVI